MRKYDEVIMNHHEELINRYYPINKENKTVDIKIYYDKATDMLDFSIGEKHHEMLSNDVLEKLSSVLSRIPDGYRANVSFVIDDYCDYDPSLLLEKLNDMIEINNFEIIKEKKKNLLLAALFLLVGFMLFLFIGLGKTYSWFGESNTIESAVLSEMLDITSWVFVWEAVTVVFLSPSEIINIGAKLLLRIKSITLRNKVGLELACETRGDIMESWEAESRFQNVRHSLLIIFSSIVLALGVYLLATDLAGFYEFLTIQLPDIEKSIKELIEGLAETGATQAEIDAAVNALKSLFVDLFAITLGLSLILDLFAIGAGISGIFVYKGSEKAKLALKITSAGLMLFWVASFIVSVIYSSFSGLAGDIILLVVVLGLFVISISYRRIKKKKKPNDEFEQLL